jgi:uncharacterized damage-inducible protein DinB
VPMSALPLLRHFARNNQWSNLRLLRECEQLSESDYLAARTSFFPSIHKTLTHIVLVDEYYLDALEAGGRGLSIFDDEEPFDTFAEIMPGQHAADARLVAFVDGLMDEAALGRAVTLPRDDGPRLERVGDVLAHLFVHQIHHRGQVHAMLAGTPVAPPQLDEYFLADDRVNAERELAAAKA